MNFDDVSADVIIELFDNYFLAIDKYNVTLMEYVPSKDTVKGGKSIVTKERNNVLGYFPTIQHAMRELLMIMKLRDETAVYDLDSWLDKCREINDYAVSELTKTLNEHGVTDAF